MTAKTVESKNKEFQKSSWWFFIIPPCVLSVLTAVFYYPSLNYGFQFDDIANITKHFDIRHNTLHSLFFSGTRWISYWINAIHYSIGGFNPFSYRVGNILIHTSNGLLLFGILFLLLRRLKEESYFKQHAYSLAFLTATLFLLHPVQTQTVSYVIQGQLEGLALLATLAMSLCFIMLKSVASLGARIMWLCGLFGVAVLACGTKEIAIMSPVLIMLVDWFFLAQGNWQQFKKNLVVHAVLIVCMVGIYTWFLKPHFFTEILGFQKVVKNNIGNVITESPHDLITPWTFFISQFKVILHYLWIFVWPFGISVEYDWMLSKGFFAPDSFVPFLGLLALGYAIVRLLRRDNAHPLAFGLVWFLICILPRSSIIPSPELLVDYKTYMASCGWLFILAVGVVYVLSHIVQRTKQLAFMGSRPAYQGIFYSLMLALPLGFATVQRNSVWSSGLEFWHNMIKNAPNKARAYNNYGVELSQVVRKFEEAVPYFKKAIAMDKNYPDPWNNLAVAYANLNKIDLAIDALKEGIKINPYYPEGYNNIASFYIQKKEFDKAEKALHTAIKLRPYYGKAYFNLGRIYTEQGKLEKAWESFKNACTRADFDVDHGFATYAQLSFNLKKYDEAIAAYEKVVKLNPDYPGAAFNLANSYFLTQQYDKAISLYKKTVERNPQAFQAAFNLGETYFTMGNFQEALAWFEKVRPVKQQIPQYYIRSAQCLEKLGKITEAQLTLAELLGVANPTNDATLQQLKDNAKIMVAQLNGHHKMTIKT